MNAVEKIVQKEALHLLPKFGVTWYSTPEALHRAMWSPAAEAEGMTYEALIAESSTSAFTTDGREIQVTHEEEMDAIRLMGVWGFCDTNTSQIHAWAAPDTPRLKVIHMLAHEIGHLTGTPDENDLEEEMRAEAFGQVAAIAFGMLPPG